MIDYNQSDISELKKAYEADNPVEVSEELQRLHRLNIPYLDDIEDFIGQSLKLKSNRGYLMANTFLIENVRINLSSIKVIQAFIQEYINPPYAINDTQNILLLYTTNDTRNILNFPARHLVFMLLKQLPANNLSEKTLKILLLPLWAYKTVEFLFDTDQLERLNEHYRDNHRSGLLSIAYTCYKNGRLDIIKKLCEKGILNNNLYCQYYGTLLNLACQYGDLRTARDMLKNLQEPDKNRELTGILLIPGANGESLIDASVRHIEVLSYIHQQYLKVSLYIPFHYPLERILQFSNTKILEFLVERNFIDFDQLNEAIILGETYGPKIGINLPTHTVSINNIKLILANCFKWKIKLKTKGSLLRQLLNIVSFYPIAHPTYKKALTILDGATVAIDEMVKLITLSYAESPMTTKLITKATRSVLNLRYLDFYLQHDSLWESDYITLDFNLKMITNTPTFSLQGVAYIISTSELQQHQPNTTSLQSIVEAITKKCYSNLEVIKYLLEQTTPGGKIPNANIIFSALNLSSPHMSYGRHDLALLLLQYNIDLKYLLPTFTQNNSQTMLLLDIAHKAVTKCLTEQINAVEKNYETVKKIIEFAKIYRVLGEYNLCIKKLLNNPGNISCILAIKEHTIPKDIITIATSYMEKPDYELLQQELKKAAEYAYLAIRSTSQWLETYKKQRLPLEPQLEDKNSVKLENPKKYIKQGKKATITNTLDVFPYEILAYIFSFLDDYNDYKGFALTCKTYYGLVVEFPIITNIKIAYNLNRTLEDLLTKPLILI